MSVLSLIGLIVLVVISLYIIKIVLKKFFGTNIWKEMDKAGMAEVISKDVTIPNNTAKPAQEFIDAAQKSAEEAGFVWEEMSEKKQEIVIMYMVKLYYDKHPDEAKEILEGEA